MATVFTRGAFVLETPFNGAADLYYFGLSCNYGLPEQGTDQWKYLGQNGLGMKLLGLGGSSGSVIGFLDAKDADTLKGGILELRNLVDDRTPTDVVLSDGTTIHYSIIVSAPVTKIWCHGTRWIADFVLTWVAPE